MSGTGRTGMSRRDFTKTATLAGLAALATRQASAQNASDTLRVGLLGCGNRGTGAAGDMLRSNDNVKLVAMADVFEDRLNGSHNRLSEDAAVGGKVSVDPDMRFVGLDAYERILATDIDVVVEGSLPYCRPKHLVAAAKAGKHIFTEKPVAVDPAHIRMVREAARIAEDKKLSFVAGTQRRHQTSYVETVEKIRDGAIGDVLAARAYWCGTLPFSRERQADWSDLEYRIRNWINYAWTSGDNIVEQHIHNLDVINWVMGGPPQSVLALGGRAWKPDEERYGDMFDHFSCDYEYANGVHMMSQSRHWYNSANAVFEEVVGSNGKSSCRDMAQDDRNPYEQEHIDLIASIRGEGPYLNEGQRVADSTLTAIMGRMSAYTGKRVTWEEATNSDLNIVPAELDFDRDYPVDPVPDPGAP